MKNKTINMSRRSALASFGAGIALPALAGCVSTPALPSLSDRDGFDPKGQRAANYKWTSQFLTYDPVEKFRQIMRLQRSLYEEDDILHWYHFIMIAVPQGMSPRPVVRWEGIELSRHEKIGEDLYRLHGHNLSFPRDLHTGEFVDAVLNPVTGKEVRPKTMALTGDPGLLFSPAGNLTLDNPKGEFVPKYGMLRREGEIVKVDGIRVPPTSWPVTFLEMGYEAASAAAFDDASQLWLPSEVSGAYVFPWPEWMEMGDTPGHMFAAWSGYKLRTVDQLPDEFIAKAKSERPDLLEVDRRRFETKIDFGMNGGKSKKLKTPIT